jgi:hypothetical protein
VVYPVNVLGEGRLVGGVEASVGLYGWVHGFAVAGALTEERSESVR